MNGELILRNYLEQELAMELPAQASFTELKEKLSGYINQLIRLDFDKLVVLLYRIDVNEAKLKYILRENPNQNAGDLIAELIIERQIQKINTREQFKSDQNEGMNDERW